MQRCIELAKKGFGTTKPNPMVGCVIVLNDLIIGEGFTSPYGGNHAEVNAINSVKDKTVLNKATLYVSLEPCSHQGKTPPCANLIVDSGIPKIVIGVVDENSLVSGNGIRHLQTHHCEVVSGVLEKECREINKRFFTFHNKKRPYIILKWAETKDGFIAPERTDIMEEDGSFKKDPKPIWISNEFSQQLVHKWRSEEASILVGTNTVILDNPKLDVRKWTGENPVRLVLDNSLRIPRDFHVFDGSVRTIVFTSSNFMFKDLQDSVELAYIDYSKSIPRQICDVLYGNQIDSLIVEGGAQLLQSFIYDNLWDEARIFIGDSCFGKGLNAPKITGVLNSIEKIGVRFVEKYEPFKVSEIDLYRTIKEPQVGPVFKDRGSKFIGYTFPVTDEEQIKQHIQFLKEEHHKARHWCFAWKMGTEKHRFRVHDDGEPNNSAGNPIYGQILSSDLTNILIVVVRYFGGTKLGVGGLINAYKTGAKLAIEASKIIHKTIDVEFLLKFEYAHTNKVMRLIKEKKVRVVQQEMHMNCNFKIAIRLKEVADIVSSFEKLRCVELKQIN